MLIWNLKIGTIPKKYICTKEYIKKEFLRHFQFQFPVKNDDNGIPNLSQRQLFFIDFFTYNFIKIDFDDTVKKQKIGIQL